MRFLVTLRRRLRYLPHLNVRDYRALAWTVRQLAATRRGLRAVGTRTRVTPPPPGLPASALWIVDAYLRFRGATCLERSMVLQSWLTAHDRPVPVAIGVGTKDDAFAAHAWLPGFDPESMALGFREISRLEPR